MPFGFPASPATAATTQDGTPFDLLAGLPDEALDAKLVMTAFAETVSGHLRISADLVIGYCERVQDTLSIDDLSKITRLCTKASELWTRDGNNLSSAEARERYHSQAREHLRLRKYASDRIAALIRARQ